MLEDQLIARINELWHKKQTVGLTAEELEEQTVLRKEYIEKTKANVKQQLLGFKPKQNNHGSGCGCGAHNHNHTHTHSHGQSCSCGHDHASKGESPHSGSCSCSQHKH